MRIIIIFFLSVTSVKASQLPVTFLNAIHQIETGGRYGDIKGDNGKARGPFQIHYAYWKDSGIAGAYSDCADYSYSVRVVTAYLNKYGSNLITIKDWQSLARIHNGGPSGHKKESTIPYLTKFKKYFKVSSI